jgi:hypothetical protein
MARKLQLVFSRPPEGVSDEEFNRWYDAHLDEILSVPGYVSAQRFRIDPGVVDPAAPAPYRYLAVYEVEGDFETLAAELEQASLGTKESYAELKEVDASGPPLPDWWDAVTFASWNCEPV